jgi:threonine dehydrogenase-like Zn-dependent dehydrogenase
MLADMDLVGSCSYSTSAWSSVLRLLDRGLVDFEPIVTHRFPVVRFEEAFAVLEERKGTVAKVLLEHVPTAGSE